MTREEYADYEKRFSEGMDGLEHFSSGSWLQDCDQCPTGTNEDGNVTIGDDCYSCEPYFSWHVCDICHTKLGGNRTDSHSRYKPLTDDPMDSLVHLRVCDDCVYYAEYGKLDDLTMLEMTDA